MERIAIGAIMKQEAPYIMEWVAYHKALGFEIIIADHGGTDDTSKILTALHNANIITRIDFRFKKTAPQIPAYRAILRLARQKRIDVVGFLDCDEFFTRSIPISALTPEVGANYIRSEFNRLNATQISYCWMIYGSKTYHQDISLPVLERFSYHAEFDRIRKTWEYKSFVKVKSMFKLSNIFLLGPQILSVHHFYGADKEWYLDDKKMEKFDYQTSKVSYDNGAILHFPIKTWEEYLNKVNRGRGDHRGAQAYTRECFKENDFNDVNSEINIDFINQLKNGINQLRKIIGNYAEIETKTNMLSSLRSQVMSFGISDVRNHKLIFPLYKRIRKIRKLVN